jgi:hypothetical protein
MVFAAAGLWLPVDDVTRGRERLDLDREIVGLVEEIHTVETASILDVEQAENMVAALEELSKHTSSTDPSQALETLDRVAGELAQVTDAAVEELLGASRQLTEVEALTEALRTTSDAVSRELLADATRMLAEMVQCLDVDGRDTIVEELRQAARSGAFPPELLERLADTLARSRRELSARLVALENVRLVPAELVERCSGSGCDRADGLLAFLAEGGEPPADDMVAVWCQLPGGRIGRGRRDAPMTWSEGSEPAGVRFQEQLMPPAEFAAMRDARLVGLTAAAPELLASVADAPRVLGAGGDSGGVAVRRQVLPRHRDVVRRYFDHQKEDPE